LPRRLAKVTDHKKTIFRFAHEITKKHDFGRGVPEARTSYAEGRDRSDALKGLLAAIVAPFRAAAEGIGGEKADTSPIQLRTLEAQPITSHAKLRAGDQ
jgi:hypothetical protein